MSGFPGRPGSRLTLLASLLCVTITVGGCGRPDDAPEPRSSARPAGTPSALPSTSGKIPKDVATTPGSCDGTIRGREVDEAVAAQRGTCRVLGTRVDGNVSVSRVGTVLARPADVVGAVEVEGARGAQVVGMTASIDHLHTSGRFDRSPQSVRDDLALWLRDGAVNLITATEFAGRSRIAVLRELPGWEVYNGTERPGADDCAVVWRKDRWILVHSASKVVSTRKSYRTNGRLIPPQRVTEVLLLDRLTGRTLYVSVSHLSAHVEVSGGIRDSLRGKVWRDATRNWARHQRQIQRQWQPTGRLLVADWNVNWKRPWFRAYVATILPAFRARWHHPWPTQGTLGNRIIDVALFTWRRLWSAGKAWILSRHESSDHRAFRQQLIWR
jgi:hypothetical protein